MNNQQQNKGIYVNKIHTKKKTKTKIQKTKKQNKTQIPFYTLPKFNLSLLVEKKES